MKIETSNYLYPQAFKDISKSINFEWRKKFRIMKWLTPSMIPVSIIAHTYFDVYNFTYIFIVLSILIYGEKYFFEFIYFKKHSKLLVKNFKSEKANYMVIFNNENITIYYNQIIDGHKDGVISYDKIKRVIESNDYYNIIGEKAYILPIDKKELSYTTKQAIFELLKEKEIPIHMRKGRY